MIKHILSHTSRSCNRYFSTGTGNDDDYLPQIATIKQTEAYYYAYSISDDCSRELYIYNSWNSVQ